MVNEFQLPRQLQEELERIDFYDGDINAPMGEADTLDAVLFLRPGRL